MPKLGGSRGAKRSPRPFLDETRLRRVNYMPALQKHKRGVLRLLNLKREGSRPLF